MRPFVVREIAIRVGVGEYDPNRKGRKHAMVSTLREALWLGLVGSIAFASPQALAQQPYYKGKRLSVMVNFAPGGSTDIEGRLFARHVARHIEGEPSVVVQNMD